MKFVFNDSLTSSVGSEQSSDPTTIKYISSNIILEKKIVTASITDMNDLFTKLDAITSESDRVSFLSRSDVKSFLDTGTNRDEFHQRFMSSSKTPSKKKPVSIDEVIREKIQGGAEQVEEPASKFAPFLETKDQIIQRLKPFMSESEIGKVFYRLEEEAKLPFTEVIGVLEFCIQKARSCNAKTGDLINFFVEHYSQKRQYGTVKTIIDLACEYQEINPTIDVFSVLRDAVAGNQPKVNLGYLSKDPKNQKIFNQIIMLSQASLPEQSEEIRRRFQESRDALSAQQQKINMQRAIYDMMKTEESNNQLAGMVASLGEAFKFLLTQPMYRALRDMFYDLRASKILLNQASSIFTGDTSPDDKRTKPNEDMYNRSSDQFPQIQNAKQPFSELHHKFVKLASPEVSRYIYSQTPPANTKQKPEIAKKQAMNETLTGLNDFSEAIGEQYKIVVDNLQGFINASPLLKKISDFFTALSNAVKNMINQITSGTISSKSIGQEFTNIDNVLLSKDATASKVLNNKFIKTAQHSVQQGTTYPGGSQVNGNIVNAIAFLTTIGVGIVGFFAAKKLLKNVAAGVLTGQWADVAKNISLSLLGLKNILIELFMQTNLIGENAPQSRTFYDNAGRLTTRGKQIALNNQETMIALGIADQDAMAIGKFDVQKNYYMQQIKTKEENLESAESQAVQLGAPNKTDLTVGDLPEDFQKKLKDFLDYCSKLEPQFKAALNIFLNAKKNIKNLSLDQQTQFEGRLAEYQSDLLYVQKIRSKWSSLKNIAGHMIRKRILLQKLKPLQTQMDTMKKLGIPMSNVIASPNGILAQVGRIRSEEQQALEKLRKDYYEKMELLKNPDKIAPMMKYPTDTGAVKLPPSPDQSELSESPFEAPENSQYEVVQESSNTGVR